MISLSVSLSFELAYLPALQACFYVQLNCHTYLLDVEILFLSAPGKDSVLEIAGGAMSPN